MPITTDIKDWFKSSNSNWGSRIGATLMLVVIAASLYFVYPVIRPAKKEDCTYYIEQNKQLVNALIDIKKDLQASVTTSYNQLQPELIMFASFDTVPKRKRMNQYQQVQQKVIYKIDSILYRIKQDSVKLKSKS
jgi:hypothetical protein